MGREGPGWRAGRGSDKRGHETGRERNNLGDRGPATRSPYWRVRSVTVSLSSPRAKPRWLVLVATVVVMVLTVAGVALAQLPSGQSLFELDGNAHAQAEVAGDDWGDLF